MKCKRRKELAEEKRERLGTGGGPHKIPISSDHKLVDDVLNEVNIELDFALDSDALAMGNNIMTTENEARKSTEECSHREEANDNLMLQMLPAVTNEKRQTVCPQRVDKKREEASTPRTTFTSRGNAIERELEERLIRTRELVKQDKELFVLKLEEQKYKTEEAKLKFKIAEEILQQEKIKTLRLLEN